MEIHAKSIGVRAFAGANTVITTVKYLPASLQTANKCYKGIFDEATIGCFAFSGSKIVFQKLTIGEDVTTFVADSDSASKAFDKSTINALYVGDNVKVIPHGCFKGTTMNLEELTIENAAIGYDAFNGRNIKIGTLNLGKNVNFVGVVSGGTNNFAWANIGTLNYNSNAVDPNWSASASGTGIYR